MDPKTKNPKTLVEVFEGEQRAETQRNIAREVDETRRPARPVRPLGGVKRVRSTFRGLPGSKSPLRLPPD